MPKKSRKFYNSTVYVTAGHPTDPIPCIDLDSYSEKYHLSKYQILRLVKKRQLKAVSYKHKMFVQDIPPN